jgi:hypothetical protein
MILNQSIRGKERDSKKYQGTSEAEAPSGHINDNKGPKTSQPLDRLKIFSHLTFVTSPTMD